MALEEKKFLDLPGLQAYDALLKALIPEADEITVTINNGVISLKNVPTVENHILKI